MLKAIKVKAFKKVHRFVGGVLAGALLTTSFRPGPKTIKKSRAWIGAKLTTCAQR